MSVVRMAMGLQLSATQNVQVAADKETGGGTLVARRRDGKTFTAEPADLQWHLSLEPGDYLLHIEAPQWQLATLAINAKLGARFVSATPTGEVVAWDDSQTAIPAGNPKNPWPPPGGSTAMIEEPARSWYAKEVPGLWAKTSAQAADGRAA